MMRFPWMLPLALLAWAAPNVHAADWQADVAASRLEFIATFEKTPVSGTFKSFDARLVLVADKPGDARLDVTIAVGSADMQTAEVNSAIAGPDWFDFAHYPQAEFHATDIRAVEANRLVARGVLRLKGVAQPVEFPFQWSETGKSARMTGEFTLKRGAFGIGAGEWAATNVIGADVKVRVDMRFVQRG